jgi:acyl-coenzyme A thioesterase PaaI-like protein
MAALASARNKESMGVDYFGMEVPSHEHLGITHEKNDDDCVHLTLELSEEMLKSLDLAHDGILMTWLDIVESSSSIVMASWTIDISTNFIRCAKDTQLKKK